MNMFFWAPGKCDGDFFHYFIIYSGKKLNIGIYSMYKIRFFYASVVCLTSKSGKKKYIQVCPERPSGLIKFHLMSSSLEKRKDITNVSLHRKAQILLSSQIKKRGGWTGCSAFICIMRAQE